MRALDFNVKALHSNWATSPGLRTGRGTFGPGCEKFVPGALLESPNKWPPKVNASIGSLASGGRRLPPPGSAAPMTYQRALSQVHDRLSRVARHLETVALPGMTCFYF